MSNTYAIARRNPWGLLGVLVAGLAALLLLTNVFAIDETGVVELDGNVTDDAGGGLDWNSIWSATGTVDALPPNTVASFFGQDFVPGASGPDPSYHEPSNKDDQAVLASGGSSVWGCGSAANPTDKNDFLNGYAVGVDVGDDLVVYGGGERHSNDGTAYIGVWIFQADVECDLATGKFVNDDDPSLPGKTAGDVLIIINFSKGGAPGEINMTAFTWAPGADPDDAGTFTPVAALADARCGFVAGTDLCADVNFTAEVDPDWPSEDKTGGNVDVAGFFEFGINITDALATAPGGVPNCFGSIMFETRSSDSIEATLKDFVLGDFDTCGSIKVVKNTVPDGPQDFAYTSDIDNGDCTSDTTASPGFSLDDDADATLSNQELCIDVTAGTYNVEEDTSVAGYVLKNIVCTGDANVQYGSDGVFDAGDDSVEIDLDPGEDVVCTFTNEKLGAISVTKNAVPDSAQDFDYTSDLTGTCTLDATAAAFTLDDDADATLSNTEACTDVPAATYTVRETPLPAGWRRAGISCTVNTAGFAPGSGYLINDGAGSNADNNATYEAGDDQVVITLAAGGDVTCTFTNEKLGAISVTKNAVPDSAQDFDYTSDLTGTCTLDATAAAFTLDDDADATLSNTEACTDVPAATYTVRETPLPAGWRRTGISCTVNTAGFAPGSGYLINDGAGSNADNNATYEDGDDQVVITLAAGGDVTCTFTNEELGKIQIVKNAVPDSAQDFDYTSDLTGTCTLDATAAAFKLDDDADATLSNTEACTDVPAATYTVRETPLPAGWRRTGISCTVNTAGFAPGSGYLINDGAGSNADNNATYEDGDDQVVITLAAGGDVTCTFENTSLFKLIILTCDTTSETLVVSGVDPVSPATDFGDLVGPFNTIAAPPALANYTGTTAQLHAYLCGLGGASFDNLPSGTYSTDTTIP